jgi:sugar phosphate isomerase/epimerase
MRYSEKYGTEYLIEPLIRYDSNILNKIEDVKSFIDKYKNKFDVERIGILADTFHMNVEESIIADSFLNNMKIIKHIHFADSNRFAPGEGHINFKEILGILKSNNYSKYISFEMLPEPDSETAAKRAITYVKNII